MIDRGIVQQHNLFGAKRQNLTYAQDKHDNHGGHNAGEGDAENLAEFTRAVQTGSFIKLGVDSNQGGQVYDSAPAQLLPDIGSYEDCGEVFAVCKEIDRLHTKRLQDSVYRTVQSQKVLNHAAYDYN